MRVHAVRLSEAFPELAERLTLLVDDPSPRVRFQLALSLGEFSGRKVVEALAKVAQGHGGDRWFRTAVLSSEVGTSSAMLETLLASPAWRANLRAESVSFFKELAAVIGARNRPSEIKAFLAKVSRNRLFDNELWLTAAAAGLIRGQRIAGARRRKLVAPKNSPSA